MVRHKPGSAMTISDALSRIALDPSHRAVVDGLLGDRAEKQINVDDSLLASPMCI